jgi:hypothetical protein
LERRRGRSACKRGKSPGASVGAGADRASFHIGGLGKPGASRRTRSAPASTRAASPGVLPLLLRRVVTRLHR